jgi:hypothetical protein
MSAVEEIATISQASMTREAVYAVVLGIIFNTGLFLAVFDSRMQGFRDCIRKLDMHRQLAEVAPPAGASLLVGVSCVCVCVCPRPRLRVFAFMPACFTCAPVFVFVWLSVSVSVFVVCTSTSACRVQLGSTWCFGRASVLWWWGSCECARAQAPKTWGGGCTLLFVVALGLCAGVDRMFSGMSPTTCSLTPSVVPMDDTLVSDSFVAVGASVALSVCSAGCACSVWPGDPWSASYDESCPGPADASWPGRALRFMNTTAFANVLLCVERCGNTTAAANFTLISPAVSLNDTAVFGTRHEAGVWVTRPFSLRSPVLALGAHAGGWGCSLACVYLRMTTVF